MKLKRVISPPKLYEVTRKICVEIATMEGVPITLTLVRSMPPGIVVFFGSEGQFIVLRVEELDEIRR
jgi:hypothetical protein